uniref:Uncharacterized protein n=1 Tax=Strombidium inclinatum TaxID=197538 RepID=A0A7S3INB0_9SPIT
MQLELLLDLDVVADFSLVLLQLLFVLFRRQINRLESGREPRLVQVTAATSPGVEVAVRELVEHGMGVAVGVGCASVVVVFVLHLHQDFDRSFDIVEHREAVKFEKPLPLLTELLLTEPVDFVIAPDLDLQVEVDYCFVKHLTRAP